MLLDETIRRYEQVHQISSDTLVSVFDGSSVLAECRFTESENPSNLARVVAHLPTEPKGSSLPVEQQQYAGFLAARNSNDVFDKWYMVGWITTNLVNRSECLRLLQREAAAVHEGALDYGFKLIYRKIRHGSTNLNAVFSS